jgi:hypothetical protein
MTFGLVSPGKPVVNLGIAPPGVIRPIDGVVPLSVNHRLPSGPCAMAFGAVPAGELGGALVGEPQVAVRTRRDEVREAAAVQAAGELGDGAARRDPPDLLGGALVGEPEISVRPPGNDQRDAPVTRLEAVGELGDRAARRDPRDRVGRTEVGEPEVAVSAGRDGEREAAVGGLQAAGELGDRADGRGRRGSDERTGREHGTRDCPEPST